MSLKKEFVTAPLEKLIPYENNPRINDEAIPDVIESIKQCENLDPIEVDENFVILSGHTRYAALKKLGYTETEVVQYEGLSEEQKRKYRILANKTNELADWDFSKLEQELADLDFSDFSFDFGLDDNLQDGGENPYTGDIQIPQYKVNGDSPNVNELYDTEKSDELIDEIQSKELDEDIKKFLIEAAKRHTVFNYQNIAEYYANADKDIQELMEKSALVIIDYDNAIANGFVTLSNTLKELRENA
jgi:hypothetical protein